MPKSDRDKIVLESRKAQHVKIALEEDVDIHGTSNGFEHFEIVPRSIPDVNYHEISLDTTFLGKTFSAPILVAGMTGGYPEAEKINISLARICSKLNIPLGVGSQRAMIVNPEMTSTFNVKQAVPDVFLIGNLGLVQFCMDFGTKEFDQALDGITADAMAIHVNAFQELCQPEGDLDFTNAWNELSNICKHSKVPVIGKEVGSGIAWEEVKKMETVGCAAVDVGGSGGTSWAKIELLRHNGDNPPFQLNDPALQWGIPTSFATWEATSKCNIPIISTGGITHGLMAAKAIAMGANMVGIARPILKTLIDYGEAETEKWLMHFIETIKRMMFLIGVENIPELQHQKSRLIPRERAREWLSRRNML